jgi:hypothetical protein
LKEVKNYMANQIIEDKQGVVGRLRLKIIDFEGGKPKVVGDSGWLHNKITNLGAQYFLVQALAGAAGSSQLSYIALGTGSTVNSTDTGLLNELSDAAGCRIAIGANTSVVASRTLQIVGTLASNTITANRTIDDIGLFAVSSTTSGSMFAGTTFPTSQLQTNQAVNITYQIQFP